MKKVCSYIIMFFRAMSIEKCQKVMIEDKKITKT